MPTNTEIWRARAEQDRAAAAAETLPMAKARLLASAARYNELAVQSARLDEAKALRRQQFKRSG